jgi:hypothetical protein
VLLVYGCFFSALPVRVVIPMEPCHVFFFTDVTHGDGLSFFSNTEIEKSLNDRNGGWLSDGQ